MSPEWGTAPSDGLGTIDAVRSTTPGLGPLSGAAAIASCMVLRTAIPPTAPSPLSPRFGAGTARAAGTSSMPPRATAPSSCAVLARASSASRRFPHSFNYNWAGWLLCPLLPPLTPIFSSLPSPSSALSIYLTNSPSLRRPLSLAKSPGPGPKVWPRDRCWRGTIGVLGSAVRGVESVGGILPRLGKR